ncbi:MAG: bifunctional DNA primase/polymerase [Planctomycetota bacterium]|jgi:hypothetical protein
MKGVMLKEALCYLEMRLSVIPVRRDKKPYLASWKDYQTRLPQEWELQEWWSTWPDANIGVVTGKVSGLVVVDVDGEHGLETAKRLNLPKGPTVKTGKGYHRYFCYPSNGDIRNFQCRAGLNGIDLRANGGYVVAPPSIHKSGKEYQWITPLNGALPHLPETILASSPEDKQPVADLFKGSVPEGQRNNALARIAGKLLHEDWGPEEVLQFALAWNRLNKPPLPEKEVKTTVQSIHKTRQNGVKGSVSQFGSPIVGGKTAKLEVTTLADIYKAPDPSWLVEKLLLDGSVTLLSAYAKDGKTFLTQEIARCVATGEPLFGFLETNQGSVLFVDSENNWSLLKDRYEKLGVSDSLPINYLSFQSVRLDTASGIEALKGKVEELQPRLVIFDTLTRFHKKKENEAGEMSNVMEALRGLAKPGRTVLPLHHNRKGTDGRPEESPRGSGDILASVDNLIILKKDKDCFVLAFQTGRTEGLGRPIRYKIESAESGSICFSYQGNVLSKEEELVQNVVKALKDNELGVEDIRMELSKAELAVGEKKLRETLNRHENREFLVRITGHNKALYKVNPDWQFGGGI